MSDKKGWGSTVLGWFVVKESEEAGMSTEPGEVPSPGATPVPPAVSFRGEVPPSPGGRVDFDAVYAAAGVDPEEQSRLSKASDLLSALPAGTDPAVKKQIVEASLKAFGVPIEKIIEAGVQEIQALEGYIQAGAADTQKVCEESQQRITEYEEEIRRIRTVGEQRVEEQKGVMKACNERKLQIQSVLEFFGQEAVARVVRESPKLVEPGTESNVPGGKG